MERSARYQGKVIDATFARDAENILRIAERVHGSISP